MLDPLARRDFPVSSFKATTSDGQVVVVHVIQQEVAHPTATGQKGWKAGRRWYRCGGVEFTLLDDGTLVSEHMPGTLLTRQ